MLTSFEPTLVILFDRRDWHHLGATLESRASANLSAQDQLGDATILVQDSIWPVYHLWDWHPAPRVIQAQSLEEITVSAFDQIREHLPGF